MTGDPRLSLAYDEAQAEYITAKIDGTTITYDATLAGGSAAVASGAVVLSADSTVALCVDGDPIYGKVVNVEFDGYCLVQVEGYATFPGGNGALLTPKLKFCGAVGAAAAKGFIRAIAVATLADVAAGRGMIVDHSVTTATVVRL